MSITIYIVLASVPYEGSSVAAVFASKASAEAYAEKQNKANDRYSAWLQTDCLRDRKPPTYWGSDLHVITEKVKP